MRVIILLKREYNITILQADKGGATVVLGTEEYKEKAIQLLPYATTQHVLTSDPRRSRPEPSKRHWTDWYEKRVYLKLRCVPYHRMKRPSINWTAPKEDRFIGWFSLIQTMKMVVWPPQATRSLIRTQRFQLPTISGVHQTYQQHPTNAWYRLIWYHPSRASHFNFRTRQWFWSQITTYGNHWLARTLPVVLFPVWQQLLPTG